VADKIEVGLSYLEYFMSMTPREQLASATMIATHEIVVNLEKAKSSLESLINGMQDLTCLITTEGRIIWGNQRAATWLQIDHDLVHLCQMKQLFKDDDWTQFQNRLEPFQRSGLTGAPSEFQLPIQMGPNSREILWSVRPFQAVSIRRGTILLLVGRDITEVLRERAEKAKLETELETAQIMQAAFFPPNRIRSAGIEICSFYRPAEQCSGDWWGHFNFGDGVDLVCVGDVTGHGAASALVTAMTQATCMAYANTARTGKSQDYMHPSNLLHQINKIVYDTFKGKFFMTFFAMLFDTNAGVVRACNAGHNFPLFLKGQYRRQAIHKEALPENVKPFRGPEALAIQGNPIGFDPETVYLEKELPLQDMDRFILFTDGIIECKSEEGQMYGSSSFRKSIARSMEKDGVAFRDSIVDNALQFFGKQPLADDLTLVSVDVFLNKKDKA
jgi:serine phosphatase RsbU (regulator of sigma subunit)